MHLNANTFSNCLALEEVILPMNLTTIDKTAFLENAIKKATLNLKATHILNENTIEELTISSGEGSIGLASYPALKSVQLSNNILDLGKNVLESCPNLEYTIENSIAYLGNRENPYLWCMYATDKTIEEIDLPYDTQYIYENAFMDCTQLIGVRIPDRVLKIEENAFYNCKTLSFVYFGNTLSSIQRIEKQAFAYCSSLTSISFPKSLKRIGSNAFECTTTLYYLGTEEKWNLIEKEPIGSPIYFYSETEIENGWHYVEDIPTLW